MTAHLRFLHDAKGDVVYPVTLAQGIYVDDNNTTLEEYMGTLIWQDHRVPGELYKSEEFPESTSIGKFDGYFYATKIYNAVYNDYAELFPCVEQIPAGQIAYTSPLGIQSTGQPKECIGIVSDQYGHLLGGNGNPDDENFVPVAVAGRVPLKIIGDIKFGDFVAANNDGTGRKAVLPNDYGCIIGKIVGNDPNNRIGYYEVLISLS